MSAGVEYLLARGRAQAERLMTAACTIRRITGTTADDDGVVTPTFSEVYSGKCRVQQRSPSAEGREVGEAELRLLRLELHLPMAATGLQPDDQATITANPTDPELVGRVLILRDMANASHKTARRIGVIEVTS
ncbi:DUF6093 family protein [Micromonospora chalcea]|uniref:DUF6093 family protein n=1 Tax=Micromonospora chalcea TaxID=1874 RepID=UPI0033EB8CB9